MIGVKMATVNILSGLTQSETQKNTIIIFLDKKRNQVLRRRRISSS